MQTCTGNNSLLVWVTQWEAVMCTSAEVVFPASRSRRRLRAREAGVLWQNRESLLAYSLITLVFYLCLFIFKIVFTVPLQPQIVVPQCGRDEKEEMIKCII